MPPKTRSLAKYRGDECLNCGVPLDKIDKFCHQCGQLNSTKKLALKDFFGELVSNIFSYDSRGWRTIKHILFKPGYVSREFIRGKRMSYANPFRFFLSVCIVFFLMVQAQKFVNQFSDNSSENALQDDEGLVQFDLEGLDNVELQDENIENITDEDLEEIENQPFAGKVVAAKLREQRDKKIAEIQKESTDTIGKAVTKVKKEPTYLTQKEIDSTHWFKRVFSQVDDYGTFYSEEKESDATIALKKLNHRNSGYNKAIYDRAVLVKKFNRNPDILIEIMLPKLPVFFFLFTPILTLFLWLIYARRPFHYMEHLIFSFNVMTFVFLSSIIMLLIEWVSFGWLDLTSIFFLLIGPFYLYKSMRNFYEQKRFKTIVKFLFINFVYMIGLTLGLLLLFLVGIAIN